MEAIDRRQAVETAASTKYLAVNRSFGSCVAYDKMVVLGLLTRRPIGVEIELQTAARGLATRNNVTAPSRAVLLPSGSTALSRGRQEQETRRRDPMINAKVIESR
jgi:hypothetical protein